MTSMIAASAPLSTSVTKSLCRLRVTTTWSTSRAARFMMVPARLAAFTAMVSIGCIAQAFVFKERSRERRAELGRFYYYETLIPRCL